MATIDKINVNGTEYELTATDTKVEQTPTTTNANYELLFSENANNTASTGIARKDSGAIYNPSVKSFTFGSRAGTMGGYSQAEGYNVTASAAYTHAEGANSVASGSYAHAEGDTSVASGSSSSHAEGRHTSAQGNYGSHAEGNYTVVTSAGDCGHAEGTVTTVSATWGHSEGNGTLAGGAAAHAEGSATQATGAQSHAEGNSTKAYGAYSHAEGYQTICTTASNVAHSEGQETTVSGTKGSHAEGYQTKATGSNGAHAEGDGTTASAYSAHAEGYKTEASGNYSHAEGYNTTAQRKNQHVFGKYNIVDTEGADGTEEGEYIEIVGNGSPVIPSNARTLDWDGNEVLEGKLTVGAAPTEDMDVTTKKYVDASMPITGSNSNYSWIKFPSSKYAIIWGRKTATYTGKGSAQSITLNNYPFTLTNPVAQISCNLAGIVDTQVLYVNTTGTNAEVYVRGSTSSNVTATLYVTVCGTYS